MQEYLEEARRFFAGDQYAVEATGCVIDAVGQVMGGVAFTLADFAFAVASNFRQGLTVSVTSTISHLGTVKGRRLIAETRRIKDGRRNCFYEVDVTDDLGTPIALVTITGAHI